ncbi:MAG: serine O-acetyltransferase EpsC [Lutibacter sp.]
MDTNKFIANKIVHSKNKPHLNFGLKHKTESFTTNLFHTLFDGKTCVQENINQLGAEFKELYRLAKFDELADASEIWTRFLIKLPSILKSLNNDAVEIYNNDPAANSVEEVFLAYPGFYAIAIYRFSHEFYLLNVPIIPRLISEFAHSKTGTDIHPGASIGKSFFIDHATGIVIGETTIIKDHVKLYQGVTLGALSVSKEMKNKKRHPTVENHVTIYANATILGGKTIIGENCTIGGNVFITTSIPKNSIVYHAPEIKLKTKTSND